MDGNTNTRMYIHMRKEYLSLVTRKRKSLEISPKSVDYNVQFPKFLRSLFLNWPIIGKTTRFMNLNWLNFKTANWYQFKCLNNFEASLINLFTYYKN